MSISANSSAAQHLSQSIVNYVNQYLEADLPLHSSNYLVPNDADFDSMMFSAKQYWSVTLLTLQIFVQFLEVCNFHISEAKPLLP